MTEWKKTNTGWEMRSGDYHFGLFEEKGVGFELEVLGVRHEGLAVIVSNLNLLPDVHEVEAVVRAIISLDRTPAEVWIDNLDKTP